MNGRDYDGRNIGEDFYYYFQPTLLAEKPGPVKPDGGDIRGGTVARFYFKNDFPDRIRPDFVDKDKKWDGMVVPHLRLRSALDWIGCSSHCEIYRTHGSYGRSSASAASKYDCSKPSFAVQLFDSAGLQCRFGNVSVPGTLSPKSSQLHIACNAPPGKMGKRSSHYRDVAHYTVAFVPRPRALKPC
jgi:hypothetical protein